MHETKLRKKIMLFSILFAFILFIESLSASDTDNNSTDSFLNTPVEDVEIENNVLTAEDTINNLGSEDTSKNNLTKFNSESGVLTT